MDEINLFLIDMSVAENTSGVDRYMGVLVEELKKQPHINLCWIHLRHDKSFLFHKKEEYKHYTKISIPLPQCFNEIIAQEFWTQKYNEYVFELIKSEFEDKKNCILHLHTLNLINLAVFIRKNIPCKIVTHLHCIPWKGLYNTNLRAFNNLYRQIYVENSIDKNRKQLICHFSEMASYEDADHVICVTHCAKDFLEKTIKVNQQNISVIPNGMNDFCNGTINKKGKDRNSVFRCLYVGVVSQSKGLNFILKAMRKVQKQGYNIEISIAGKCEPFVKRQIECENKDLSINILGRISFDELKQYYTGSDVGIIASLQEQSSYVAIEMAMFYLPIITTAVDGLDEMFTHKENALKVNTLFSNTKGLTADVDAMAEKIISLIENKALQRKLSRNVRNLYEEKFTADIMLKKTLNVYNTLVTQAL